MQSALKDPLTTLGPYSQFCVGLTDILMPTTVPGI